MSANVEIFSGHRDRLFGIAYRMLGSRADAEDVLQDAWLRWHEQDSSALRSTEAWLTTMVTRLAIDRLRAAKTQRATYFGPWLPEPLAETEVVTPESHAEFASDLSVAFMHLLERLGEEERAAFVLHDVFGLSFAEVATTLDRSEAAVRQLANRARGHVHSRRPEVVDRKRHDAVLDQFIQHLTTGDMDSFMALLAPDVVLVTDGGGIKRAALRPIHGPEKVVRWLVGVLNRPDYTGETRVEVTRLNDETAILLYADDELDTVAFCTVEDRGITALYFVRNPVKLGQVTGETATLVD